LSDRFSGVWGEELALRYLARRGTLSSNATAGALTGSWT
jgi:hypothetical protein